MRSVLGGGALAVLLALAGLAGCSDPSEEEQLADRLESQFAMEPEVATCVADQVFERFSSGQIDTLREAESRDDLSEELLDRLRAALTPCASAGS